ncbi:AAA family ATPase [Methylotenera sp. G11]|uniref:AAA family ATPase n=1 Tax=Methylotenera sp. G11 TaxID=1506585 RepID=UPI000645AA68|nr:AAA family ATPase [Methylotenera sp. G11]
MRRLKSLSVSGYKSIKDDTIVLGTLNVLIGGNGVGKSNWISVFKFLRQIVEGRLQLSVGTSGRSLLYRGGKEVNSIGIKAVYEEPVTNGVLENSYDLKLNVTDEDALIFADETVWFHRKPQYPHPIRRPLGSGHSESKLCKTKTDISGWVTEDLASYRIYHFHDTSASASIKQMQDIEDNKVLYMDAANLAPYLYWMKRQHPDHFEAIESAIRQIAPFFDKFELSPSKNNPEKIRLEWREKSWEQNLNPHLLSDGTLRFMCLATLLLQPMLPRMILLDEPELGLHPAAIKQLAELLKEASQQTQLFVATQSVTLINQLELSDIFVADRIEGATKIRQFTEQDMVSWIDRYSIGELWEKNLIGGKP